MHTRIRHSLRKLPPGPENLYTPSEAHENSSYLCPPSASLQPSLKAPLQQRGSMQPRVHQESDSPDHSQKEQ